MTPCSRPGAGVIGERLWIEHGDGAARAHPVVPDGAPHFAVIEGKRRRAIRVRLVDCEAQDRARVVPLSELTDAAPLSPADEAEYDRLDALLTGTFGDAVLLTRFNALRLRSLMFSADEA